MTFREQQDKAGYLYVVEDVFGKLSFTSPVRLGADGLDAVTMTILQSKALQGRVGDVEFHLEPLSDWSDG